jgi:hypothetical protein
MKAEGATSNTDEEIRRCLGGCVAGSILIETARAAREHGIFRWEGNNPAQTVVKIVEKRY